MKERLLFGLTIAGLLFSGYLGGVKLFGGTCAFNESCPYFLGYPTCYYGFAMYLLIFLLLLLLRMRKINATRALRSVLIVSLAGILFAGYYSLNEIMLLASGNIKEYFLGLPTCAYGLLMYLAICILTIFTLRERVREVS